MLLLFQSAAPMIHFDWSLNIGNVTVATVILLAIWKLLPLYRLLLAWQAEHELFLKDYAERHHMSIKEVHSLAMARIKGAGKTHSVGHS